MVFRIPLRVRFTIRNSHAQKLWSKKSRRENLFSFNFDLNVLCRLITSIVRYDISNMNVYDISNMNVFFSNHVISVVPRPWSSFFFQTMNWSTRNALLHVCPFVSDSLRLSGRRVMSSVFSVMFGLLNADPVIKTRGDNLAYSIFLN